MLSLLHLLLAERSILIRLNFKRNSNKSDMREFVIDIKNLVVKHWGKLIILWLLASLILNYGDFMDGFHEGYNSVTKERSVK
jgi:hypothetical protein